MQSPVNVCEGVVHPLDDRQMFEGNVMLHAKAGTAAVERKPMTAIINPARRYFLRRLELLCTFRFEVCALPAYLGSEKAVFIKMKS